jgi:hypothetical protein
MSSVSPTHHVHLMAIAQADFHAGDLLAHHTEGRQALDVRSET